MLHFTLHTHFQPFCFCNPLSVCYWLTDWLMNHSCSEVQPCSSSPSLFPPLFMWQRPELLKSGGLTGGLMVGTVARATHKHFRDVNKCVHAQRATMEVFSRLPHIKCTLSSSREYTRHIQTPNVPVFKKIWCFCQLGVISCRYFYR